MTSFAVLLSVVLMAGNGPTALIFSGGEKAAWQRVTANGQILGAVADTPIETPAGCYGMGRLFDRTIWVATEQCFWTLSPDLTQRRGGVVAVETIAGSSGRHLYRIVRGARLPLRAPELEHEAILEEIDPQAWAITRAWHVSGHYRDYGRGHLTVNWAEGVAYYATQVSSGVVHRHDLRTDTALPDLVNRPVSSGGLLCFHNGTVVVGYRDGVRAFSPDGALVQVFPVGPFEGPGLLAHGADQRSFWVQGCDDSTPYSTLYEWRLDGTLTHQWNTPANGVQWDAPFVDDQRWRY